MKEESLDEDEVLVDAANAESSLDAAPATIQAPTGSEMHIDEEGIPRFAPDKALVGRYWNLFL